MILVDANLLLYAYDSARTRTSGGAGWLEDVLAKPKPVLFPWQSIHTFRIATNPRGRAAIDYFKSAPK
jgi:predicted nucleic acid-binding protein